MDLKNNMLVKMISGLMIIAGIAVPAFASGKEGKTIADLPPTAQMAVSEAMGRDNKTYHAEKIPSGYEFVSASPSARYLTKREGKGSHDSEETAQKTGAFFCPRGAVAYNWQLSLSGIGRGNDLKAPISAQPEAKANRVEYKRGNIAEWYINGPLGLEQGFTLNRAPDAKGAGPLTLAIDLPKEMQSRISADKKEMTLSGKSGIIRYGKLAVWDATGKALAAYFEVSNKSLKPFKPAPLALYIRVDDSSVQYPITIDPFVQQQELTASGGIAGDYFGSSVSLSSDGNTVLVGAVGSNSGQGAAYVFTRSGSTWSQQQELTALDGTAQDGFGSSVSLSGAGNTALVGAAGSNSGQGTAYVFTRNGSAWTQQQELTTSDGAAGDSFGISVSLSSNGNTALVGAVGKTVGSNGSQGAAYVFTWSGSAWSQQKELTASDGAASVAFGWSVSLSSDGNTALVGAAYSNSAHGTAYVFTRSDTTWSQQQELTASDGATDDYFGGSVSLSSDGNTALVGAYGKTVDSSTNQGAAYVFTRSGITWSQQQELTASDGANGDEFGYSVSLSSNGNTALVGAFYKTVGSNSNQGEAYVFTRSGTTWSQQQELIASDGADGDEFGYSVSLSSNGNTALVGAVGKTVGSNSNQGAAYVFGNVNTPAISCNAQTNNLIQGSWYSSTGAPSSWNVSPCEMIIKKENTSLTNVPHGYFGADWSCDGTIQDLSYVLLAGAGPDKGSCNMFIGTWSGKVFDSIRTIGIDQVTAVTLTATQDNLLYYKGSGPPGALQIIATPMQEATGCAPYTATLIAIGGSGSGYTWSVTQGSLPTGFDLSPNGVLSSTGTPAAPAGHYGFTIQVTDSNGNAATQSFTLVVLAPKLPDLTITKSHMGNFKQGQTGALYTIKVTNKGNAPTNGAVTVVDTLPTGLTATAMSGTGWSCILETLTCTRSNALAASASYPPITLKVNVAADAPSAVTNVATVSGGGETNTANDTASNPTSIIPVAPDLTISKSHTGNFKQRQTGALYTIKVTNKGNAATNGTVTVVDTLPTGLSATAMSGTGWDCTLNILTCARSNALAAGASYPPITLKVNVAADAPSSVTNVATVSGGGETNTANDTASNPTTITPVAPDLTITKSHTGNFKKGQTGAIYTIKVTNKGNYPISDTVTVVDTLPVGLTATAMSGTGWNCDLNTLTCSRSSALAAGASYPPITLKVNVASDAPSSVTNTATVSGGGETNTANDTASNPTNIL